MQGGEGSEPKPSSPRGFEAQRVVIEDTNSFAGAGLWGIGGIASIASIYRLVTDYFQFGSGPIVGAFLTWWTRYVHLPLDFIYSLLPFELLQFSPPSWLRDFHVLSIVGASLFVRGTHVAKNKPARSWVGLGSMWVWNIVRVAGYGLIGFGAVYFFSGVALVMRPHRFGLTYRSLVRPWSHPLLGLYRATAFSIVGVFLLFALSYVPAE